MELSQTFLLAMRFNFLYVDRYVFRRDWYYPESDIPYCILRYMIKGSAMFIIDGIEYKIQENQIAYIPEGCKLECHGLSDEIEFISIRFATTVRIDDSNFLEEYFHIKTITPNADQVVLGYFTEIYKNALSNNAGRHFRIRGNLELIIAYLMEQEPSEEMLVKDLPPADLSISGIRRRIARSTMIKKDARIQRVVDYLVAHPTEPFDTHFLSEMAQISPSTLRRLFKVHTGKSPGDFAKELRMVAAARKLLTSSAPVSEIAYEVGFDDPNYFTRIFKQTFGVSPVQYRKSSNE